MNIHWNPSEFFHAFTIGYVSVVEMLARWRRWRRSSVTGCPVEEWAMAAISPSFTSNSLTAPWELLKNIRTVRYGHKSCTFCVTCWGSCRRLPNCGTLSKLALRNPAWSSDNVHTSCLPCHGDLNRLARFRLQKPRTSAVSGDVGNLDQPFEHFTKVCI